MYRLVGVKENSFHNVHACVCAYTRTQPTRSKLLTRGKKEVQETDKAESERKTKMLIYLFTVNKRGECT